MKTMNAQELVEHINEILRIIKEGETIEVTNNGEVIAHLVPTNTSSAQHRKRDTASFLEMLNRHTNAISTQITEKSVDAVEIVREGRRELYAYPF